MHYTAIKYIVLWNYFSKENKQQTKAITTVRSISD